MHRNRKIIHIDMDAFFASIEQLDNPELNGQPVIVGGRPDTRGVVAACSYEARHYGIRSAMPCATAYRLCPQATFITPRLNRYREFSQRIMTIFRRYTDLVEPLSLDEAYLDITLNKKGESSATRLAQHICKTIFLETGLTASAGVSCNKFIAKTASDINKPNGITVIPPEQVLDFLATLPIGRFFGIGKVTEKKMLALGIKNGADLRARSCEELIEYFGKLGNFYYNIVRGEDPRVVTPHRLRKSIGAERTLKKDSADLAELYEQLNQLVERICGTLTKKNIGGRTLTLKIRYGDFTTITRSLTHHHLLHTPGDIVPLLPRLMSTTEAGCRKVRLIGLSLSKLSNDSKKTPRQLLLPFLVPLKPKRLTK